MRRAGTEWVRSARIFALEAWWPPFMPHLELDWDKTLWTMKRLHLDTLQANALTKWAQYPTDLVQRHPELGDRDLMQESDEFCKRHGFRWIMYTLFGHAMAISSLESIGVEKTYRPMFRDTSADDHPELKECVPEGFRDYYPIFQFGGERMVSQCAFATEGWLMAMAAELAERYDYDAAWVDGSIITGWVNDMFWNVCTCPVCLTTYAEDHKQPMPILRGFDDPRLPDVRRWEMRRIDALLTKVTERLTKGRTVPMVANISGPDIATWYPPVVKHFVGGLFEGSSGETDLVRKVSASRQMVEVAWHYPDFLDRWPRDVSAGWEVENNGLTILGYGGSPYLCDGGKYYYDSATDEPAARVFALMEEQQQLISQQDPYAYCAVPYLTALAPRAVQATHDGCVRGWISALLDTHVPVMAMPHFYLPEQERIRQYSALLLADLELMSNDMLQSAYDFASEGGGVYLSFDPARIDEDRQRKDPSLLRELFDLQEQSLTYDESVRRQMFEGDLPGDGLVVYDAYLDVAKADTSRFPMPGKAIRPCQIGHTVPGASWTVVADVMGTIDGSRLIPGIAYKAIGKGRAVFSTVPWERQYYGRRDPHLARWMRDVVLWLGNRPLPVELSGSRLLHLATTRVEEGWLLYLVNSSNDVQHYAASATSRSLMKVAERPLPIGPAEVVVPNAREVTAVYGPQPDAVAKVDGSLRIHYAGFHDHVVLHVR